MTKKALIIIFLILIADQALKFYVKLNFFYGEEITIFGDWFKLSFLENKGMAWGAELPIANGKLILSLFRVVAVTALGYYLHKIIQKGEHKGYIAAISLIFAGALGNIIDSTFYGVIFESSFGPNGPAKFITNPGFQGGYETWFYGNVVDMLHFPLINGRFPDWMPFWGGDSFLFFSPVFNIADTAISVGVGMILVFQKRYFPKNQNKEALVAED